MATTCPALSLPLEAFEVITSNLCLAEVCAVESTCKAWRHLGLLCAPAPVSADVAPLQGRLDTEEKIDSFGFWLFKRGANIERLKYEHLYCQRHNTIAFNVFQNVSTTLSSLHLVVSKYARNRRGLPGHASFNWLPAFPNLSSLFLDFQWSVTEDWELVRWAPNLKELILRSPTRAEAGLETDLARVFNSVGDPSRNELPASLECFKAFGPIVGLSSSLRNPWVRKLTSLSIQYPTKVDAKNPERLMHQRDIVIPGLLHALNNLGSIAELALELSSIGRADYWNLYGSGSRQYHVLDVLTKMKKLKTLKWAHTDFGGDIVSHEKASIRELMKSLSSLERLHISGKMTGWQDAALQGAFSQVKELLVVSGNTGGEGYFPKGGPCLENVEHLIVDFSVIKTSFLLAESRQLEETSQTKSTNRCEFAAHMKKLKKVTVLTTGFASFYGIENISDIITWLRNLMRHTGNGIAVEIEGEEYVSRLRNCLQLQGVAVAVADAEITGSAEVWKKWEYDTQMDAIQNYDDLPDPDDYY
ncbi:hypothetical protein Ndes2526A_g04985 [Nannochloris sp. 'desiccata']